MSLCQDYRELRTTVQDLIQKVEFIEARHKISPQVETIKSKTKQIAELIELDNFRKECIKYCG